MNQCPGLLSVAWPFDRIILSASSTSHWILISVNLFEDKTPYANGSNQELYPCFMLFFGAASRRMGSSALIAK
jgi:hypothetical protein